MSTTHALGQLPNEIEEIAVNAAVGICYTITNLGL